MKQKITLLFFVALIALSPRSQGQNLLKESFDTSSTDAFVFGNFHNWTDSIYQMGGCCAPTYHWIVGQPPGTYNSLTYVSYGTLGYSEWYPSASPHSGKSYAFLNTTYMLYGGYIYAQDFTELRSPTVSLPSSGKTVLSYWVFLNYAYYGNSSVYYDSLQVWVNTVPRSYGPNAKKLRKLTIDSLSSSSSNAWVQFVDTIPTSYNGQNVTLMFKGFSQYYYYGGDVSIDDVSIDHYFDCNYAAPHAGMPSAPVHVCRNRTFNLVDTGGTRFVGYSYQWQKRPHGTTGAWANIGNGNPLAYSLTNADTIADFRVYMNCPTSGFTDTSSTWTITADTFFRCYCALPTTNTDIGGSTPPRLDSVAITGTTLKNVTKTAFSGNYGQISDSVNQTRAVVSRGGTYTVAVKYGGTSSYGMMWIDWNQSGSFNDTAAAEYYVLNSSLLNSASLTFTVPVTARTGRTGLRIRTSSIYSPSAGYSCTNFTTGTGAGETADYIITVTNPPTVDLGITTITSPPIGVTYCPNKADTISATVTNFGSTPLSNFYIYANYTGPSSGSIYTVYTGTLAPLTSANVYIGTIDPPLGGSYSLQVYPVVTGDAVPINDTMFSYFNLYPLPADPIVKSDTVCPGGTAHIGVAPVRYQQFKWYRVPTGGTAFDSTTYNKSVVAPSSDSTYYIVATDSNTKCVGNRVPLTAAMRPKPTVNLGPDTTLCESPTFFLDAGNPGGSKYAWNNGDTTRKINPRLSGTYIVNVFHYCTVTDSVNLTINPLPAASGIDYVRTGNTYGFSVAGALYTDTYEWYFGDGGTSTLPNPTHTYTIVGPYNVMVILHNSCGADTISWGVPNKIKNIGQQNAGNLNLYPNPANNILTVSTGDNTNLKQIMIVNAIGSVVYSKEADNAKSLNLDISMLPQGQYILRATTNDGVSSKMFDVLRK